MTVPSQQLSFQVNLVPPDPVTIRCKKCKAPLEDTTWKNCDRCRRIRTESFNRWKAKKSVLDNTASTPLSTPTAAPTSNPNPRPASHVTMAPNPGPSTFPQAPSLSAPPQHYRSGHDQNRLPTESSQTTRGQPRTAPTPVVPQAIHVPEFQRSDELIDQLSALPPRSRFVGKFSVIADPAVDNTRRAHMIADQLRARGIPISCVVTTIPAHPPSFFTSASTDPRSWDRQTIKTNSRNPASNAYTLIHFCTCQETCYGQIVVSVDDDVSHPYDVLGQRIGVAIFHPSG